MRKNNGHLIIEAAVVGKKDRIKGDVRVDFVIMKEGAKNLEPIKIIIKEDVKQRVGSFAVREEFDIRIHLPKLVLAK